MSAFKTLSQIDVNDHVEKKKELSYLSWAWAWDYLKKACPDAGYEVVKNSNGLPYFESSAGVMVYTKVTVDGITHEMWLPVLDGAMNTMKAIEYTVTNKYGKETKVLPFDMFDVNKTIMRCFVKNMAMFGLGLYIYAGEDLPEVDEDEMFRKAIESIEKSNSLEILKGHFTAAILSLPNKYATDITNAKDKRKEQLIMKEAA